ncbi:MAG: dihydrofolate reductase [Firmicutes bacterium]|nr:dihydrofolate reductase [Bacillota bacterium]
MKNLVTIAAIGKNHELGYKNDLIWTFREDLQTFKNITMGHYIVMGENTYKSLPVVLKGRKYLVLSPNLSSIPEGQVFGDLESFIEFAKSTDEDIFVCGGGMIYRLLLPHSGKMILTEIDDTFADATVHFPTFDREEWTIESSEDFTATHKDRQVAYKRNVYKRK